MAKAVVFWSGTGNTEAMAERVAQAASADLIRAADFTAARAADYDAIAFGCPAMGDEVLEETEFEPMFTEVEKVLSGKKVALFFKTVIQVGKIQLNFVCRASQADFFLLQVSNHFLIKPILLNAFLIFLLTVLL